MKVNNYILYYFELANYFSVNAVNHAGDLGSIPGSGRSPGEGMATHFSILAWKIPWTEEPSRLQALGSQRVGHDLVTKPQPWS